MTDDPVMTMEEHIDMFLMYVKEEVAKARLENSPFHSAHEAYAVLKEELEEYWEWVKKKPYKRDRLKMYVELVQLAAMALCAAYEC